MAHFKIKNMIHHYFKITFRNLRKYKTQSFIGIFGLAFGLACFVPAFYWMRYETSYDAFYPDAAHIYRIYSVEKKSGKKNERVPGILKTKLYEQFPATEAITGFVVEPDNYSAGETPHIQLQTLFTDSVFFRVFPQVVVSGNARQPMQTLHNIVLTETVAIRLFGDAEKAIGQQIKSSTFFTNLGWSFTVTAVVKDPPDNTNLSFDAILFSEIQNAGRMPEAKQWEYFNQQMYVKIHPRANVTEFTEQMRDITTRLGANTNIELRMLPISDIRHGLNTDLPFTLNFIHLFIASGILLLFIALFNFLTLHLDLFRQRIREFRQRMVHGATSGQLIGQMMFELTFSILLAMALSCCFVVLARPLFSGLVDIAMPISQLLHLFAVCGIWMTVLMLFTGFIPFWRLSHLAMHSLAKGKSLMRRVAVTVQLAVSVVFIVAALVVMMQMRYVNRKDFGFDRSGIIQMYGSPMTMLYHGKALMNELAVIPQIENMTVALFEPQHSAHPLTMTTEVEWQGKPPNEKPVFQTIETDSRFAETFHLKIRTGKWWNDGDKQKVVLNEEAVRVMGLSEPVGAIIRVSPHLVNESGIVPLQEYEVVGVVNDFHTLSLRNRIQPAIFKPFSAAFVLYIRAVPGQELEAMRRITVILPNINASLTDVRLTLLDELYDRLNRSEQAGLKMFSVLATVCLLISLFGIYAVATASTQRRRKEIAIRKVMGAQVSDIVSMFFREHTLQVILAGVVALPLAYLAMSRWLQGYAYRTNIPWWLLAGVITVIIAVVLLTVLGQVLKAANGNPAEVVKSE